MAKFDFEEYRQPWETGPHWELKREFLEHYQDTFDEDRLLCLAQAYSNIVLLHCSYPAPVMIQINELSKSLKGIKKFRGEQNSAQNSDTTPQKRKGKRRSESEEPKKFKFIKFCSGESKLLSGENPTENSSIANLKVDDSPGKFCSEEKNENPSNNERIERIEEMIDKKKKMKICNENPSNKNSTVNVNADVRVPVNNLSVEIDNGQQVSLNVDYASISQSKDFRTISLLASQVKKFVMFKKKDAMDIIQASVTFLKIKNVISFKFNKINKNSNSKIEKNLCEFFVGSTRIAVAEGKGVENAKKKAAYNAFQLLMNFESLPTKNINASQNSNSGQNSKLSETDLFLLNFAKNIKSNMKLNQTAVSLIHMVGTQMKILDSLVFNISLDLNSPNHNRNFMCDFSIRNISISQGKASSKKRAKQEAAESGKKYLLNLLESKNDSISNIKNTEEKNITIDNPKNENFNISKLKEEKINPRASISIDNTTNAESLVTECISKDDCPTTSNSKELSLKEVEEDFLLPKSLLKESKAKPLKLNRRLLGNSFRQQFVLFDRSEIEETPQSFATILSYACSQCRKNLSYEIDLINEGEIRANLFLDKKLFVSGTGDAIKSAKLDAAKSAVEILRKNVYTIKIKNELEDSLVISRIQMSQFDTDCTRAISEGNLGHKMLKMMGWSGGGIGKSEGRVEPVMVDSNTPGKGLGFKEKQVNNMTQKQFLQKIETLLKDFSLSNSMNVLVFTPDFLKSERASIHKIAIKFNLNHNSYGKEEERHLCIRRKYSVKELLDHILQSGGSTDKYELVDMSK